MNSILHIYLQIYFALHVIYSLRIKYYIIDPQKLVHYIIYLILCSSNKITNPDIVAWINNDGLLTSWLLKNMRKYVFSVIVDEDTIYKV